MDEGLARKDEITAAVEDALRTYPLTPEPRTLLPGAMARVRRLAERPRFRLSWLEWALGLFVLLMSVTLAWAASFWLRGDWLAAVRTEGLILWETLVANWVWAAAAGGLLLLLGMIVAAAGMVFAEPRYSLHYE
jgi:hypothetical protein